MSGAEPEIDFHGPFRRFGRRARLGQGLGSSTGIRAWFGRLGVFVCFFLFERFRGRFGFGVWLPLVVRPPPTCRTRIAAEEEVRMRNQVISNSYRLDSVAGVSMHGEGGGWRGGVLQEVAPVRARALVLSTFI